MISLGYNSIIDKEKEISRLKKRLIILNHKEKIYLNMIYCPLADLEQDRFLWAQNMEKMGKVTPDDIAITGLRYR